MPRIHQSRIRIARIASLASLALALVAVGLPAATNADASAVVTSGDLHAFATSADPAIVGHATMIRTAEGRTIVTLEVRGLEPDTAYHSHVHKQACSDNNAGGHYRFDPTGPAAPPNEIWLDFTTNIAGIGRARAVVDAVAGPAALAVVVHTPGGAKIACADLG